MAALRAEAVALRDAGDKIGAVEKVRAIKALRVAAVEEVEAAKTKAERAVVAAAAATAATEEAVAAKADGQAAVAAETRDEQAAAKAAIAEEPKRVDSTATKAADALKPAYEPFDAPQEKQEGWSFGPTGTESVAAAHMGDHLSDEADEADEAVGRLNSGSHVPPLPLIEEAMVRTHPSQTQRGSASSTPTVPCVVRLPRALPSALPT